MESGSVTEQRRGAVSQELPHTVAQALNDAESTADGLREALRRICEVLGWSGAEYWQARPVSAEAPAMTRSMTWWTPELRGEPIADPMELTFTAGQGLAGAVRSSRSSAWVTDLRTSSG